MTLFFPTEKSFFKADNLFKHDFLLRQSFDTVDLLWYRTHEPTEKESDRMLGLDETDLSKIERTVDNCPDNELESTSTDTLKQLADLQCETEVFDFYYEFYYQSVSEVVKDDLLVQRRNEIIHDLKIIETEELSTDYEKFWDYVYEKTSLKAIISPEIWDTNLSNAQSMRKAETGKKVLSDVSDVTVTRGKEVMHFKHDEASLMNARLLLQQLKDRGLEEDRLTYVNVFAEEDEEDVEAEFSSSGTLSTELDVSASLEPSASRLTEISFEKDSPTESDVGMKDPFKDRSYDCLYYVVRLICEHLENSSDTYFSEAPIILLENDLVLEMKERELKHLNHYCKIMNNALQKIVGLDGIEGVSSRSFRHGILRATDELVSQMEKLRQEGVETDKKTKIYSECTYTILRAPKVERSDYRKLVNFDLKTEEAKSIGQKRKIKHFKTMVCLSGRTKLRRYDYSEKITGELNHIRVPMHKIANLTKVAREHATLTVNGYLETLVKLTRQRMFYEDYPDDMFTKMKNIVDNTKSVLKDVEEMKERCAKAKEIIALHALYKPIGHVNKIGQNNVYLDDDAIKRIKSELKANKKQSNVSETPKQPCFTPGLNCIMRKAPKSKTKFVKTVINSDINKKNLAKTENDPNFYVTDGIARQFSKNIDRNFMCNKGY